MLLAASSFISPSPPPSSSRYNAAPKARLVVVATVAWLICFLPPLVRELRTTRDLQFTQIHQIGKQLAAIPQPATMLVTEAGFLPYDSGWQAINAWGLNTSTFAHQFIQPGDIARLRPDLIVLHPDLADSCLPDPAHLPHSQLDPGPT